MAAFDDKNDTKTTYLYRITGPQSIERLEPLLIQLFQETTNGGMNILKSAQSVNDGELTIVWETTCEKAWRQRHSHALILNKLNNSQVCGII